MAKIAIIILAHLAVSMPICPKAGNRLEIFYKVLFYLRFKDLLHASQEEMSILRDQPDRAWAKVS